MEGRPPQPPKPVVNSSKDNQPPESPQPATTDEAGSQEIAKETE